MKGKVRDINYNCYYDPVPENPGWYCEYRSGSIVIDDSMKTWHPDMPRRRNAGKKAERIARAYARRLAKY
jgi:hypothetical protein